MPPAAPEAVTFPSGGARLVGTLFPAGGPGPYPAVVLLHGLPGRNKNHDFAARLQEAGWAALVFHYRGAWGSGGRFSLGHVLEDVGAALRFLRGEEARARYRVDPDRLALAGVSMGGFAGLMHAASGADVLGVASLAGFNFGLLGALVREWAALRTMILQRFQTALQPLHGASPAELLEEVLAHGEAWDLARHAPALARLPLFLLAGSRDLVAPPEMHHAPLVRALEEVPAARLTQHFLDTDHFFSGRREEVAELLAEWLKGLG